MGFGDGDTRGSTKRPAPLQDEPAFGAGQTPDGDPPDRPRHFRHEGTASREVTGIRHH